MQVHFWGTRGSLPTSISSRMIETKIFNAVRAAQGKRLETDEAVRAFIRQQLPFADRQSYGGNTACVEVTGANEYLLCDAGTGLRDFGHAYMKAKADGQGNLPSTFHLFISHLHWDHIQGFPFFTPAYVPGHRIRIYGYHEALAEAFVHQQSEPYFPVPLDAMRADITFHVLHPDETCEIGGVKVSGIKQRHPGESYGYRFEKDGKIVVYSTDAEHKEDSLDDNYRFVEFFKDADLLIFDAQYNFLDAVDTKENWGHSSNLVGVELAVRAGVRRLCLFHHEHTFNDESLDCLLDDTRKYLKFLDDASTMTIDLAYDDLIVTL